ncbi:MAG: DUF975 family protein [Clostridia bacterium]|nr:DUF975 family protein [Clostridia bacterium]
MFAKDYRKLAWSKLTNNWGTAIVVFLLYTVIISISASVGVGPLLLSGLLGVGMFGVYLDIVRGNQAKIEGMFDGFRQGTVNNLLAGILITIFTALWSLLFVIPGIVKSYSYAMTYFILKDNPEMSANDAITESRKMMNGNKWRLFCLDFSFIGWILLSMLTCGLLVILVQPYMYTARAAFYESIKGAPVEAEATEAPAAEETTEA